jgi:hypothetical protein
MRALQNRMSVRASSKDEGGLMLRDASQRSAAAL